MFNIYVEEENVLRMHDVAIHRLSDMRPVMGEVASELQALSDNAFANLADPVTGAPWAPLAPSTVKQRQREKKDGPILQKDRFLRTSTIGDFDGNSAQMVSSLEYALIHQHGGKAGRGHSVTIPQRRFAGASEGEIARFDRMLADFILNG